MDTTLERGPILATNAALEAVRVNAPRDPADRPDPEWVRGTCPKCGDSLISNCYYAGGRGYIIYWQCWAALTQFPTCDYRRAV